jgi:hypothetical protein
MPTNPSPPLPVPPSRRESLREPAMGNPGLKPDGTITGNTAPVPATPATAALVVVASPEEASSTPTRRELGTISMRALK